MALSREHLDDREALQPMASMSVVIAGWTVGVWTMWSCYRVTNGMLSVCGHCRLDRRCVDDAELAGGYQVTKGMLSVCGHYCHGGLVAKASAS